MTVFRACTRSGARSALRTMICGLGAALAVVVESGCSSSNTISNGTPVITVTDSTGDFTSYVVNLATIQLTRTDGGIAYPLINVTNLYNSSGSALTGSGERVDFTQLSDLSELMNAPAVPTGTYTSATVTLDYSTAIIAVDVNGQSQIAKIVDATSTTGAAPTAITFTVKFDPSNPLVVTQGQSTRLALDFDLAASSSVDLTTSPPTVTVKPFMVVTAKPTDTKTIRSRGGFVTADTGAGSFIVNARPFHDPISALGAVSVQTTAQTYFNINGTAYTGAAGLAVLAKLTENMPIASYGTIGSLAGITPVFNATAVYAGTSLESTIMDHVNGVVSARSGNTLTVHGATYITRQSVITFSNNATVTVSPATIVSEDGRIPPNLSTASISIGQQIDVSGQGTTDTSGNLTTLDATAVPAQVRLAPTTAWGTLNSGATPTSLSLNLASLGRYAPGAFNFTGTGMGSGLDANATNYLVNTGSIDESATPVTTLLKADGFVNTFGAAPPDFNATAIALGSAVNSQLIVEWGTGGTTAPFTTTGASGLVVDLSNTKLITHVVRTGPTSVDPATNLSLGPLTVTTASVDPNTIQLAVGNTTNGISVFNTASAFATQLGTTLNGSTAVHKLVAVGHYNAGTNTFTASRIDIALQ
jgi:hypothetical protein